MCILDPVLRRSERTVIALTALGQLVACDRPDPGVAGPRRSTWTLDGGGQMMPRDAGTDAGPPRPETFAPVTRPLSTATAPYESVRALQDGSLLALSSDGLVQIALDGTSTRRASHDEIGRVDHAMQTRDGLLVATPRGWVSIIGSTLEEPGLEATLPAASVLGLVPLDADRAWVGRDVDVALWAAGEVRPFALAAPFDPATLVATSTARGAAGTVDVLWGLVDGRATRLTWDGTRASADQDRAAGLTSLALSSSGRLFAVRSDGSVLRGDAPGALEAVPYVEGVVAAIGAGPAVWLARADGTYVYAEDDLVFIDAGASHAGTPVGLADGSLALVRGTEITRLTARWDARLEGVRDGDELLVPRTVTIVLPEGTPAPDTVSVRVGTVDLPTDPGGLSFVLDPAALVAGTERLSVTIRWADGTLPMTRTVSLSIPGAAPTWSGTIQPIFAERCAECHGRGGARPLDTLSSWQEISSLILYDVQNARMPKPPRAPLTPLEIARIEAWVGAGFPP